jgi:hypothetical protein
MILENTNCKNSAKNEIRSPFLTTEDAKVCAEDAEEEPVIFFLCVLCVKSLFHDKKLKVKVEVE